MHKIINFLQKKLLQYFEVVIRKLPEILAVHSSCNSETIRYSEVIV